MILDVTAQLVDTIGAENVTTTLIAEHARISVGSIYSYYKDRGAIFDAIVTRSIERQDEIIASYRRQAEAELNSERVPEALKETIKQYFLSLSGDAQK